MPQSALNKVQKIREITWCAIFGKLHLKYFHEKTYFYCTTLIVPFLEHNVRGSMHLYFEELVSSSSKLCVYYNYTLLRYFTFTVCTEITEKSAIHVQSSIPKKIIVNFTSNNFTKKNFFSSNFMKFWIIQQKETYYEI